MKHVFVLAPPKSGSTEVHNQIGRCAKCAFLPLNEGQKYFGDYPHHNRPKWPVSMKHGFPPRNPGYYANPSNYNWTEIRRIWEEVWDENNSTAEVRVEKSPPNCFRWKMLEEHFENAHFIISIRDPYASIFGFLKHFGTKWTNMNAVAEFARDWLTFASALKEAAEGAQRALYLTYEQLCDQPHLCEEKVRNFVPELADFSAQGFRSSNKVKLNTFTMEHINRISEELRKKPVLCRFWNVNILTFEKTDRVAQPKYWNKKWLSTQGWHGLFDLDCPPSWAKYCGFVKKDWRTLYIEEI